MKKPWGARLFFFIAILCAYLALQQLWNDNAGTGVALGLFSRRATMLMAVVLAEGILEILLLTLTWTQWVNKPTSWFQDVSKKLPRWLALLGYLILLVVLPIIIASDKVDVSLLGLGVRVWFLWIMVRLGAWLLRSYQCSDDWLLPVFGTSLMHGVIFVIAVYLVPALTLTPYSLGWSEASRFYNASLFLAQPIYGVQLPLPTLHPTRYLLQSIAFLIPNAPILVHRIWQVMLWIVCNGFTAWALVRRLPLSRWKMLLVGMWAFTFFFIGPVYYHLVLCAGWVLLTFDRRKPLRSLWMVLGASIWAGISRINWYPVPGVMALVLYLLEEPRGQKSLWRYLLWPTVWVIAGTAVAFAANEIYVILSGNPPEVFGSALSSPLLWYRLFPNNTYPQGILQAAAFAFLPVVAVLILKLVLSGMRWNWLRWLGLSGVLVAFFAAGLVVSVKVGGGSNLHNLDNFIVLLAVVAAYIGMEGFTPDHGAQPRRFAWVNLLVLLVALLPMAQPLAELYARPKPTRTPAQEQAYLVRLQAVIDAQRGKGPVLFISNRQLITFKNLKVDQFEAEYEKVFLMEMAMSGNPQYLGKFTQQLQQHRFPLILTEPLNANLQDQTYSFSEENNLWVERVEQSILANYRRLDDFNEFDLVVYVPK